MWAQTNIKPLEPTDASPMSPAHTLSDAPTAAAKSTKKRWNTTESGVRDLGLGFRGSGFRGLGFKVGSLRGFKGRYYRSLLTLE